MNNIGSISYVIYKFQKLFSKIHDPNVFIGQYLTHAFIFEWLYTLMASSAWLSFFLKTYFLLVLLPVLVKIVFFDLCSRGPKQHGQRRFVLRRLGGGPAGNGGGADGATDGPTTPGPS